MADPVLTITGAGFHLAPRWLLQPLSCTLAAGEVLAVIGPNGAGKSTLLQLLAGDLKPSAGTVTLAGRDLAQWSLRERARRLAVLPQHTPLTFPFTAAEVIALGRLPHDEPHDQANAIVEEAAALLKLNALLEREYPTLSGGEQQRVQLARVLAQLWGVEGERLLLLDEPTSALDMGQQALLIEAVEEAARLGVAIVLVTHDINLARQLGDRVLALKGGECCFLDTAGSLRPALLAELFEVSPAIANAALGGITQPGVVEP